MSGDEWQDRHHEDAADEHDHVPRRDAPGDSSEPELELDEQGEAKERSAVSAKVVWAAIKTEGEEELERCSAALFWSALAAGLSMGFSLITEALLYANLPDVQWRPILVKAGYSMGFLFVVLGRQQLFTENTLTVILPLLAARGRKRMQLLVNVLRLWGVVLVGNFIGAALIALVLAKTSTFDARMQAAFAHSGIEQLGHPFGTVVLKGIFAGWIIASMVWLLPAAETARVRIILLLTWLVALGSFSHIIAGSVDMLYLVFRGELPFGAFVGRFFVPTLIGNVLGGTSLVAALNHAQVVRRTA